LAINGLAETLVINSTSLDRNILPLQRDGPAIVARGVSDRRRKELHLTDVGLERLNGAWAHWARAQAGFAAAFGAREDLDLQALLRDVDGLRCRGCRTLSKIKLAGSSCPSMDTANCLPSGAWQASAAPSGLTLADQDLRLHQVIRMTAMYPASRPGLAAAGQRPIAGSPRSAAGKKNRPISGGSLFPVFPLC
jgi:DNA-binding MarR family transcriptional regulator